MNNQYEFYRNQFCTALLGVHSPGILTEMEQQLDPLALGGGVLI